MLRWIKKKCKRHVRKPVSLKSEQADQSCHEGIDFHIYEEVPPIGSPPAELAYCIVPLVDKLNAEEELRKKKKYAKKFANISSNMSEIICTLCEKPLPGVTDSPESATCRCSGLNSFRSSNGDSSDKFSWLDYDCDNGVDVRQHLDLAVVQSRLEARARSRQPIYLSGNGDEDLVDGRFMSDDSGGFFDSGHNTDSSLEDSVVNNLDSLDLADSYYSPLPVGMSPAPRMGCRVIRRTRSAHESLCASSRKRRSISSRPMSQLITPAKISQPVPSLGVHRSTEKSSLLRSSLKRRLIKPENKTGRFASVRTGLQLYGRHEDDMGYEPASTDEEEICIDVEHILRSKKNRGKKCLMKEFNAARRQEGRLEHFV